jgi:O-antigen/teichoic acid export membrane protein
MALRNILMIVVNLLYFGGALWLVPHYGLLGLAFGQVAQAALLMILSWIALRRELSLLPLLPINWSKKVFKEIFGYAINFQINSIAILLFDPLTKLLMSKYGGLTSAAYYEMASQLVVKLRALLISANQALVPEVAELHETSPHKLKELYIKIYRLVFFMSVPYYAAILIALPVISMMWIGRIEEQFLLFGALLVAGWGFNNLTGPAYFFNFGTGDLKWNSISHVLMAVLNVLFGLLLGPVLGGFGVLIGSMIALAIASCYLIAKLHAKHNISIWNIVPEENYFLLMAVAGATAVSFAVTRHHLQGADFVFAQGIGLGIYVIVVAAAMYVHPYKKLLTQSINSWRLTRRFTHE